MDICEPGYKIIPQEINGSLKFSVWHDSYTPEYISVRMGSFDNKHDAEKYIWEMENNFWHLQQAIEKTEPDIINPVCADDFERGRG